MSFELQAWNWHRQGKDPLGAFTALVNLSPAQDVARCQLVTALLLSIWQLTGRSITPSAPSFLLVNGGSERGQVWSGLCAALNTCLPSTPVPRSAPFTEFLKGNPGLCRQTMQAALATRRKLDAANVAPELIAAEVKRWLPNWRVSKAELFPSLEIRNFASAWDKEFGLVTHEDDCISLLVPGPKNLARLQRSLAEDPGILTSAQGVGDDFITVPKQVSLLGGITAAEWSPEVVSALLNCGIPFYFLPHVASSDFKPQELGLLRSMVATFVRHHRFHCIPTKPDLLRTPLGEDVERYGKILRRLSAGLPGGYAFNMEAVLRLLGEVVVRLCLWVMPPGGQATLEQTTHFYRLLIDLHVTAARGLAYGTAALGFHGYGNGILQKDGHGMDVLSFVRSKGRPCSRRDIQRKVYHLKAHELDIVLADLQRAALVTTEGKYVEAIKLTDYLGGIARREQFPEVTLLSAPPSVTGAA